MEQIEAGGGMVELVHVHAVIQVEGGQAVSQEITETPIRELSQDEFLAALRLGPAVYADRACIGKEEKSA